jgi:hypothetical protein
MTLSMADSITPARLPDGYDAYLGYADGTWPTADEVRRDHPGKPVVVLTVTGDTLGCDGIDCEPGNPGAAASADWVRRKLAAHVLAAPVIYASVAGAPGYGMPDVLRELAARGIARDRVRLLSAHYTMTPHICGPAPSCGAIGTVMDGTQWTDAYEGMGGVIDVSSLRNDFFGAPSVPAWQEDMMQALAEVRQGATGPQVRTVQGLCGARGRPVAVDGVFGDKTLAAVRGVQEQAKIAVDGIVGPQTWVALMGI